MPQTNCQKFYMCVSNSLVVLSCPVGLKFDQFKKKCDYENLVMCGGYTSTTTTTTVTTKSIKIII